VGSSRWVLVRNLTDGRAGSQLANGRSSSSEWRRRREEAAAGAAASAAPRLWLSLSPSLAERMRPFSNLDRRCVHVWRL